MIILLVIFTFAAAILLDHLLLRRTLVVLGDTAPATPRPRVAPPVVAGFNLPDNLAYHPGHTWAAAEGPTRVRIGIDDLAAKVAGDVEAIEMPARGRWIRQGQRIIALHRGGRELDLVSPMEGEIVDVNDAALRNPNDAAPQNQNKPRKPPRGTGCPLPGKAPAPATTSRTPLGGPPPRRWMDD